ncbi:FAD-dependent monooxygenase [Candidatus Igneacidithiobacillus taiwanensis]|uniref:FAD-dependent monooxygenase n=1 Tax=Candidatus Igneacidithiobacillus taiwanensis TaxID=1945924 RepID=UPI00289F1BEA|nr:FAD-dependent monooxygenase [Candidatus Igneacidithiobacillus taiwanensis]MCE5360771.1 FAD-dependent monooxygenase [Acidithiobacillus sp.]
MRAEQDYDVLISGAGMVGAALGLALQRAGLRVAIAERRSESLCAAADPLQRSSLVNAGAGAFLAEQGVDVASLGTAVVGMRVWDAENAGSIQLDAADVDAPLLGHICENQRLEQELRTAFGAAGGTLLFDCQWQSRYLDQDAIELADAQENRYRGRLLAIAEGRQSSLRQQLIQSSILREDYQQEAIVATVQVERPHGGIAYQRFLPTGPIALLPFANDAEGRPQASLVWSARTLMARQLFALDNEQFLHRLQLAFGPQLGVLRGIGPRGKYPLSALHVNRYVQERVVLLGDSAHGVHPLAGLGVNLGFRDVVSLSNVILAALRTRQDFGQRQVLLAYQRERRPDNLLTVATCGGLNHLFSNRSPLLARLRDLGLWGTSMTPPLKRFFIRQAMGL